MRSASQVLAHARSVAARGSFGALAVFVVLGAFAVLGAFGACTGPPSSVAAGAAGDRVFDTSRVHEIELVLAVDQRAALDAGELAIGALAHDGAAIGAVTLVRVPGEPPPGRPEKLALRVDVNGVEPTRLLDGIDALLLDNDSALFHERIAYELARRAGLRAPRAAHAIVRLDGVTLGYYVVVEAPSAGFFARAFGDDPAGGRLYRGPWDFDEDPASAPRALGDADPRGLAALAAVIRDAPDASFAAELGARLDLEAFITYFAVEAALVCTASYSAARDHFGLYENPADGRFVFVPEGMDVLYTGDPVEFPPFTVAGLLSQRVTAIPALAARHLDETIRVAGLVDPSSGPPSGPPSGSPSGPAPSLDDLIVAEFGRLVAAADGDPALEDDVARTAQSLVLLREGLAAAAAFARARVGYARVP